MNEKKEGGKMNAVDALSREKVETGKRVAALKEETECELLQKEKRDLERDLVLLKRPSIFEWIKRLFRKGGKRND